MNAILPFSRPALPAADAVGVLPLVVAAKALALMLDMSIRTVRVWDASGRLPTPLRVGGRVVWRISEIESWLEAGAPDRARWAALRSKHK